MTCLYMACVSVMGPHSLRHVLGFQVSPAIKHLSTYPGRVKKDQYGQFRATASQQQDRPRVLLLSIVVTTLLILLPICLLYCSPIDPSLLPMLLSLCPYIAMY